MKTNKTLLTIFSFFIFSFCNAQNFNKLSPAFRYIINHPISSDNNLTIPELFKVPIVQGFNNNTRNIENGYIAIIYTTQSKLLIDKGIQVQSILPKFITAWVTLNQVIQLSELNEVTYIDAPKIVYPVNDICVATSGASLLNSGKLNNTPYKGDGVIVGVFDTGIDWDHPDFRNPTDQTKSRILRIWDQTISPITGEISPTGFNYGVEYTQAHLNNELDGTPTGFVRERDIHGHGTHVTGTAAGNGSALASLKYAGVAPNADIVVVKGGNGSFSTSDIINALTYFQNVATAFGKPIVVNMSIGGQSGAHDGTNAEEVAVDFFSNASAGRVLSISAGNSNGTSIHKQNNIAAYDSTSITINVPAPSGSTSTDVFQFSLYVNDTNTVKAILTIPGGTTIVANAGQSIAPLVLNNTATVYFDNIIDVDSGDRLINIYLVRASTSANPSGAWVLKLINATSNALITDGWLNYKGTNFGNTTVSGSDNNYLVGSPGTATSAVTVGSFVGKLDWYSSSTTVPGGYAYSTAQQDNISTFSSKGPRRDNVQKPNITASGQAVVSCTSSDANLSPTSNTNVVNGLYRVSQGTSMSSPEVAGCIALLLQIKPTANYNEIRNAITQNATKDFFTTFLNNNTWGSGKIDVYKAASSLLFCKPNKRETYSYDSSSTNTNNGTQSLGSSRVATRFTSTMNGKLGGVYFKTGTTIPVSSFIIEVRTNEVGYPGDLLGSLSISPSSISRFSWNYFDISSLNIEILNDMNYFIVLVPGNSDSWGLGFESLSVSGRSFVYNGTSWIANNDLRIRSVVYDNTIPTPTLSNTNLSICSSQLPYTWNGLIFTEASSKTKTLINAMGCDSLATLNLTINLGPSIGVSTSAATFCTIGSEYKVVNSNTNGGGVWTSSNTNVATISTISGALGIANANANGTTTFSYTKTGLNGCTSVASTTVTVAAVSTPNNVTGINSICTGSTTTLSSSTVGGVWSSLNNRATINSNGIVTGTNAGIASIKYTVTNANSCNAFTTYSITVNPIPNIPSISYAIGTINPQKGVGGGFCTNKTFTLVGTPSGGSWSSTGVLSVTTPSGVASTGPLPGSGSLTYTISSNGCSNSRTILGNIVNCAAREINNQSINQSTNQQFTMYPNPAKSVVSLQVDKLIGAGSIVITDLYGKQIKMQPLSMGNNLVNIANLSKGFYFVSVITNEGKTTKKLIVE